MLSLEDVHFPRPLPLSPTSYWREQRERQKLVINDHNINTNFIVIWRLTWTSCQIPYMESFMSRQACDLKKCEAASCILISSPSSVVIDL